jgi:hypothetical protein
MEKLTRWLKAQACRLIGLALTLAGWGILLYAGVVLFLEFANWLQYGEWEGLQLWTAWGSMGLQPLDPLPWVGAEKICTWIITQPLWACAALAGLACFGLGRVLVELADTTESRK